MTQATDLPLLKSRLIQTILRLSASGHGYFHIAPIYFDRTAVCPPFSVTYTADTYKLTQGTTSALIRS